MTDDALKDIPEAITKVKNHSISPIWVIPVIAACIGAWLVFKSATQENIIVEVAFKNAAGLEAGKTLVKLRNVKVGEVTEVKFTEDLSEVVVVMELSGMNSERLTDTTQFWVIRPRVGLGGVSGLDTLLSGAYIEIDPGEGGEPENKFKGLEEPQIYQLGNPGTKYILKSDKLGSLNRGSPVKYRGITVGSVTKFNLIDDHSYVEIEVFIESPHDRFVSDFTRFWNVSGFNLELGAKGFNFDMESIGTLMAGGVAFTNDNSSQKVAKLYPQSKENNVFILHKTEEVESEEIITFGAPLKLYFNNGVSGLSVGAPVELKGIRIGTVLEIGVESNKNKNDINVFAIIDIEPERLPKEEHEEHLNQQQRVERVYKYLTVMVTNGLRAQLKSNILTGQSLIVLDFFENFEKDSVRFVGSNVILPTVPETVSGLIKQINEILTRIKSIPLENISQNISEATKNINDLIKSLNVENGGMTGVQINETLDELSKAARSIRVMSEYLERHPEALIKGKRKD
jgi:paraquat-inducible protein B